MSLWSVTRTCPYTRTKLHERILKCNFSSIRTPLGVLIHGNLQFSHIRTCTCTCNVMGYYVLTPKIVWNTDSEEMPSLAQGFTMAAPEEAGSIIYVTVDDLGLLQLWNGSIHFMLYIRYQSAFKQWWTPLIADGNTAIEAIEPCLWRRLVNKLSSDSVECSYNREIGCSCKRKIGCSYDGW